MLLAQTFDNYEKVGIVGLLIAAVLGLVAYIKGQHRQQITILNKQIKSLEKKLDQEQKDSVRLLNICHKMLRTKKKIGDGVTMDETIRLMAEIGE